MCDRIQCYLIMMKSPSLFVTTTVYLIFLQSISINHLVPSKHTFAIIYGNILKLILTSLILVHSTIYAPAQTATRRIKQQILS